MESFQALFVRKKEEIRGQVSHDSRYTEVQDPVQKKKIMTELLARTLVKVFVQNEKALRAYFQFFNIFKTKELSESSPLDSEEDKIILICHQIPDFFKKFQYVRERVSEILAFNALTLDLLSQMRETEWTLLTELNPRLMAVTRVFCQIIAEDQTRIPKIARVVDVIARVDAKIVRVLDTPH